MIIKVMNTNLKTLKPKITLLIKLCLIGAYIILACSCKDKIAIVIPDNASLTEKIAAEELSIGLSNIYQGTIFQLVTGKKVNGNAIYLGAGEDPSSLGFLCDNTALPSHDGYIIKHKGNTGIIYSESPRGVLNGVYGLLNKLGYGLFMNKDVLPSKQRKFSFNQMDSYNEPVAKDRISFIWHNFLSSCSGWNIDEWRNWVTQSQKSGFNSIMLHSYGNTPIFNFEFNGKRKWVSRIANTQEGREWRIQHCNDIRRTIGGELYGKSYFGSDVTTVKGDMHETAVQELTREVLELANARGMKSIIALDIDTEPSNDQDMIRTLPESARFRIQVKEIEFLNQKGSDFWIANPETPEGYAYYKAQVESMLKLYPTLNNICLWVRIQETPLMGIKKSEFPNEWKAEYDSLVRENPDAENYWRPSGIFALSKIIKAFKKAAGETNPSLKISLGTWFNTFLKASDYFIDKDVQFIYLEDSSRDRIMFSNSKLLTQLQEIASSREIIPIFWAHEDNGKYYGCPLKPVENLGAEIKRSGVTGYGILHFMIKTSEFYSFYMNNQIWSTTVDQTLEEAAAEYAAKRFSSPGDTLISKYLVKWINEGIAVGRETGARFITRRYSKDASLRKSVDSRLEILEKALSVAKTEAEKDWILYYIHLEDFIYKVTEIESHFFKAEDLILSKKYDEAKKEASQCKIEDVISYFSKFIQYGEGVTRDELGLLASMNLRWYPSYIQLRQALGIEPIRYNFAATNFEPRVHEPGWATYFIDKEKNLWNTFGACELNGVEYCETEKVDGYQNMPDAYQEIIQTGLIIKDSLKITISPNIKKDDFQLPSDFLREGKYNLKLLITPENDSCQFNIKIAFNKVVFKPLKNYRKDITIQEPKVGDYYGILSDSKRLISRKEIISNNKNITCLDYPIELRESARIVVSLATVYGIPKISALILEKR